MGHFYNVVRIPVFTYDKNVEKKGNGIDFLFTVRIKVIYTLITL